MRRRRPGLCRLVALVVAVASGAALLLLGDFLTPGGGELAGRAAVVDGDTLTLDGQRIRLHGVDAPEARQVCKRDGAPWRCGADAAEALRGRIAGRPLRCEEMDRDRYGRVVARCHAGEEDIGAWLVREGLAVAYTEYSRRYFPQELLARREGRGVWGSSFERPEEWRRRNSR